MCRYFKTNLFSINCSFLYLNRNNNYKISYLNTNSKLSTTANRRFALLLGLRFCLSGKYSDIFNYIFLRNSYICFGQ